MTLSIHKYLLLTILVLTIAVAPLNVASPVSQQTYYVLKQQGIVGPYTTHPIPAPAGFIANFNYNIVNYGENYTIILANGVKSYINTPGYPMLPVYTYKLEINGYIPADSVHAYVLIEHFIVKQVAKPILPAPQPIFYDGKHQNIKYITNTTIYENNRYYPGKSSQHRCSSRPSW